MATNNQTTHPVTPNDRNAIDANDEISNEEVVDANGEWPAESEDVLNERADSDANAAEGGPRKDDH